MSAWDADSNKDITNVNYFEIPEKLSEENLLNGGWRTYVISPIDNRDKISTAYRNCTGLIVTGIDKITSENISFLSHQDPGFFLNNQESYEEFKADLVSQIEKIKDRCEEGTIDSVIVGGNSTSKDRKDDYVRSIKLLSNTVEKILNFSPIVATGPKLAGLGESVYFDTKNRNLIIVEPFRNKGTLEAYNSRNIDIEKRNW